MHGVCELYVSRMRGVHGTSLHGLLSAAKGSVVVKSDRVICCWLHYTQFQYIWTVNWKFVSEETFLDRRAHVALLVGLSQSTPPLAKPPSTARLHPRVSSHTLCIATFSIRVRLATVSPSTSSIAKRNGPGCSTSHSTGRESLDILPAGNRQQRRWYKRLC